MIDLNLDLLAAGVVATTVHAAGFMLLGGSRADVTRSEMTAVEVMDIVLVAPPAERIDRGSLPPSEWSRRVDTPLADPDRAAEPNALLDSPMPVAVDESSLVAPVPLEPSGTSGAAPAELPRTDPPRRLTVDLPDAAAPSPPPTRATAPIVPPTVIRNEPPKYPERSRERGHEGTVDLRVQVLESGAAGAVEILRSSGHAALDRAALRAARRWRFAPATRAGRAIEMWTEIPVHFYIEDETDDS